MLEILENHLQQNMTAGMQRRINYFTYVATVGEIDRIPTRIQQLIPEAITTFQITAQAQELLTQLGFDGEISQQAPRLHFTLARAFAPLAVEFTEDKAVKRQTTGAIVFAHGTDEDTTHKNALDCSSLLAGIVITSQTAEADNDMLIPSDRFTLAFMTRRKEFHDKDMHIYPFPPETERQRIEGTITHTEVGLLVNLISHTPKALHALRKIMEVEGRRQKQVTLEQAAGELLSHFFVDTLRYVAGPFSHFYRPRQLLRISTQSE